MSGFVDRALLELDRRPEMKRRARRAADAIASRVLPSGPRPVRVLAGPLRGTRLLLDLNSSDRDIWLNTYEPWMQHQLRKVCPGAKSIWDIGAYVGSYAIMAARMAEADVLAVEPDPANVIRLRANLDHAGEHRVQVVEAAVGNVPGRANFASSHGTGRGMTANLSTTGDGEVSVATLDDLLDRYGPPDVVLMDIEGGERDALLGATSLLHDVRPVWLIELHGTLGAEALRLIEEHGYAIETSVGDDNVHHKLATQRVHIIARPSGG